ncbi:MAG TPA: hypothetical protein VM529_09365 [Gemmata sp.]|nr:hypothetical protein [Gemmata sp.]
MPDQPDETIPLEQRQVIFRAVVEAQDGGTSVAESRAEAVRQFAVTEEQVKEIEREGLANQWPPL